MIKTGDKLPTGVMKKMGANGPEDVNIADFCKGRKIAFFSIPGAYTPTCSAKHLPGFIAHEAELKQAGIDEIVCFAVNDPFVMGAWGKSQDADGKVTMLADGSGDYTKALGLELDLTKAGLGMRGQRFAMVVNDGKIEHLAVEAGGEFKVSSAESVLASLKA